MQDTTSNSEDLLSADDLEKLVRETVVETVTSSDVTDITAPSQTVALVGHGVRALIRSATIRAIHELAGRQSLLVGVVGQIGERLSTSNADAKALLDLLTEIDRGITDSEPKTSEVVESEPENESLTPPVVPHTGRITSVNVGSFEIPLGETTPNEFRTFFAEFVQTIQQGPVSPSWALQCARRHGYNVVRGTVVAQIESYLGDLSKGKDKDGNNWWWIPGWNDPEPGSMRSR